MYVIFFFFFFLLTFWAYKYNQWDEVGVFLLLQHQGQLLYQRLISYVLRTLIMVPAWLSSLYFNLGITLFILLILCSSSDHGMSVTSEYSVMFLSFLIIVCVSYNVSFFQTKRQNSPSLVIRNAKHWYFYLLIIVMWKINVLIFVICSFLASCFIFVSRTF